MNYTRITAIDLEQTCWEDKSPGDIIQIGMAEIDLRTGEITDTWSYYIETAQEISEYCVNLTGITRKKMKSARPFQKVLETIHTKVGTRNRLFCQWGDDSHVLRRQVAERTACDFRFTEVINLHHMFGIKYGINTGTKTSLLNAMSRCGLSFVGPHHDALHDAINTARLAKALLTPTTTYHSLP